MEARRRRAFQNRVWTFYKEMGRRHLPWRQTHDAYCILVSEIMLQQTQVDRVMPKYEAFLALFPDATTLARASLKDVLSVWVGLGYNRRARFLHMLARKVVEQHDGVLPKTYGELVALPGIGPYTAGAVMAFAYNEPVVMIETNIRSVFLHECFKGHGQVHDKEILEYIEETLDTQNPREWYAALMDYGAHLKKTLPNPSRRSRHHMTQSPFKGSRRELRGCIVRALGDVSLTTQELAHTCKRSVSDTQAVLTLLEKEGMVTCSHSRWQL